MKLPIADPPILKRLKKYASYKLLASENLTPVAIGERHHAEKKN